MTTVSFLRASTFSLILGAAFFARADDAYSNFSGPNYGVGFLVAGFQSVGFQFTATATGDLGGFTLPMNNAFGQGGHRPFTLSLYADNGSNELGTTLGAYAGLSTGLPDTAKSGVSHVAATGAPVGLTNGSKYWLVASTSFPNALSWNWVDGSKMQTAYYNGGSPSYDSYLASAFSVQLKTQAVPEPTTMAAMGVGLVALVRRRRSA